MGCKNEMLPLSKRNESLRQCPVGLSELPCLNKFNLMTVLIHPSCFTEQEDDNQRSNGLFKFAQHSGHWLSNLCFTLPNPLLLFLMSKTQDKVEHLSQVELEGGIHQFMGLIFQAFVGKTILELLKRNLRD